VIQELELLLSDPTHVPAGGGSEADLAVVIDPAYVLSMRLLRPEETYTEKLYRRARPRCGRPFLKGRARRCRRLVARLSSLGVTRGLGGGPAVRCPREGAFRGNDRRTDEGLIVQALAEAGPVA
jgi:hypothetical protein